jgi:gliding motility-associated-like protein
MYVISKYIFVLILLCFGCIGNVVNAQSFIDTACAGETGAVYRIQPNAGSTYYWTVEGGAISSYANNGSVITVDWGTIPGIKKIGVSEVSVHGCHGDTVFANVLILNKGELSVIGPDAVCKGEIAVLRAVGNADRYEWSTGSTETSIAVSPKSDSTFMVTGYFGECGTSVSLYELQVKYRPNANFEYSPKEPAINEEVQFTYTGSNNVNNWKWTFDDGKGQHTTSDYDNPQHIFDNPGIKVIKLSVSNDYGCTDTITKFVVIQSGINVFIATAFTPNQDGLNNTFLPVYENVESAKMLVYDRWGELVFSTESLTQGWDGNFKGVPAPDGVYVYVVQVVGKDHNNYTFDGTITLLR